jgi:hypothetical protein
MQDRASLYDATIPGEPSVFPPITPPPDPQAPNVPDNDIPVEDPTDPDRPPIAPDVRDPPLTPSERPYQMRTNH